MRSSSARRILKIIFKTDLRSKIEPKTKLKIKNEPEGSFYIDSRVISCAAEDDFHLRLHPEVTEGWPAEDFGIVVASDVVDVLNKHVFHGELLSECLTLSSLTL